MSAPSPGTVTGDGLRTTALLVGSAGLAALILWLAHDSLIDDAYITLSYAKNLAADAHWGLTPQQVSNSASAPGNVLLIAAATTLLKITGGVHPVDGLGVVSIGSALALAWGWSRTVRALQLSWAAAVLGVGLVLLNPIVLSALGLEVLPVAAVLVVLLAAALDRRPVLFGVVAGFAVLIRLDLVVFVVPVGLATAGLRRRLHLAIPVAVAIGLPWYAWSWWYFGSAVPDTLVIKTLQRDFNGVSFADGPLGMYQLHPLATVLSFLAAALGAATLLVWLVLTAALRSERLRGMTPAAALGVGGIAYYLVYSGLHVPPYHWYYVPPSTALVTFLAVAVGAWLPSSHGLQKRMLAVPAAAVLALVVLVSAGLMASLGGPWRSPLLFGNYATQPEYARVGTALGERVGDDTVAVVGEIGTLAYFCECALVNEFSDRGVIVSAIDRRLADAGPAMRRVLELNYQRLDRSQQPRPTDYELRYEPGPGSGKDVWQVNSPASGVGRLILVPTP